MNSLLDWKDEVLELVSLHILHISERISHKDVLSQLVFFTKAKQKYSSIIIIKMNFQKFRLSIDINSIKYMI